MCKLKIENCDYNNLEGFITEKEVIDYIEKNKKELYWHDRELLNKCVKCKETKYFEHTSYYYAFNETTQEMIYSNDFDELLEKYDDNDNWQVGDIEVSKCSNCDLWFIDYNG